MAFRRRAIIYSTIGTIYLTVHWFDSTDSLQFAKTRRFRHAVADNAFRLQTLYQEIADRNLTTYKKHGNELSEVSDALNAFRTSMKKFQTEKS